ncbi:pas fold family protein [Chrysochromulina tobinii]|uniref:histidine kinase n=1 Tax=Chrysochromulina tobinii TaxID=1460289 RepID=A0A0M0JH23_9EUKA|nr:pas fold family protein [Chrysochromulina tobinii]|eukprot:KOO25632.1 pas fold family protein [Chrysochromulina sp. CCMP291]
MWIAVAIISFALYIFIFWRVYDHWLNFQNAKAYESRTSMRRRSMELSFYLISACAATWSGFVVIWSADALLYGVFGVPRGPFDFSFYWDLFIDVLAKLVYADAIESSAPLLKIRFSLDALETAGELRRLFDKANAPIFGVDDQCRVAEWNEKATSITGYSARETIGQDLVERFVAPEIRASVRRVLQKALRGHETSNFELVLVDKAENRVRVLLNATTRRNVDGAIVGVVGIGQDVTEMRKVEDKARQYAGAYSERLLRSFDLSLDLVTQIDFAKENAPSIYYASPSFRAVLGHSPHDVLGDCAQLEMLFSTQSLELLRLFIQQMRSGKDGVTVEYPMLHIDGHEVWFEHKASRHPENPDCVIVVSRDITDRRERHRLEVENARLSAARERDIEAMHFLSHELKNRFVAVRSCRLPRTPAFASCFLSFHKPLFQLMPGRYL